MGHSQAKRLARRRVGDFSGYPRWVEEYRLRLRQVGDVVNSPDGVFTVTPWGYARIRVTKGRWKLLVAEQHEHRTYPGRDFTGPLGDPEVSISRDEWYVACGVADDFTRDLSWYGSVCSKRTMALAEDVWWRILSLCRATGAL